MNPNQKKKQLNRGLSIALALLIVAAVCVTVIAVVSGRRNKPSPTPSSSSTSAESTTGQTLPPAQTTNPGDTPIVVEKLTFLSPLTKANISKEWSADIPVFSDTMEDYRVHLGVDLAADAGTPVYAAADGTVEKVEMDPMMGQTVVISHKDGYKTVYRNLQTGVPETVKAGAAVKAGTQIGQVGDTALIEISQMPHLHFELYAADACENPLDHIQVEPINAEVDFED